MFYESPRFPECIAIDAHGGPRYFTEVVTEQSGFEQRNEVWQYARLSWEVGQVARPASDMQQLIAFFRSMHGREHAFRFKDFTDFAVPDGGSIGLIGANGTGEGTPTQQLFKKYAVGVPSDLRKITKPIASTVALLKGGAPLTGTLDATTGLVTFAATATATVTGITKANPAVVTTLAAHGYANGALIYLRLVTGMTQVNNLAFTIGSVTANTFALVGVNSTSYGTFTGTALAERYLQPSDSLRWTGEFDVPARFDTDQMAIQVVDKSRGGELLAAWESIPILEVRV